MVPPAPGLLSMTTLCPSVPEMRWPMRRAITSAGPPGAKPTTIRIGLLGNDCADALPPSPQAAASSAHTNIRLLTTVLLPAGCDRALERDNFSSNRHPALGPPICNSCTRDASPSQEFQIEKRH